MLTLADVSKSYGTRELFSDVSLFIARTDRLGLVGANGTGKTTLFNLILGEERADTGAIEWVAGYLVLARDNVACALSELTDGGWLAMDEAKRIARDWFFNNPNEFYKLGFPPCGA